MGKLFDIDKIDLRPELIFRTSRSSGKGGQHVNKTESRVEVEFHLEQSGSFPPDVHVFLLEKVKNKFPGLVLLFSSETHRSQYKNKEEAIEKLYRYIDGLLLVKKKRKPTKIPKAIQEKRLQKKKRRSEIKKWRRGGDV